MRHHLIVISCIAATALAVVAAPAEARRTPALGIADQKPGAFTNPRFKSLHVRRSRVVVPWNTALVPSERQRLNGWLRAARRGGVREVVVAFGASRGSNCPARPCRLPSTGAYTHAFRAFRRHYRSIREIQPWNEANSPTQPTGSWRRGARAAARFYNIAKRYCRHCSVTAADVLDLSRRTMARWVHQFRRYAHHPRLWGLHNYTDTNKHSGLTSAFLHMVPGQVWITETGGIVYFRRANGHVDLRFSERRAAAALRRTFTLARKFRNRISRLYLYQWSIDFSGNRFDAGLVRANGSPRPGYFVVQRYRRWLR